MYHWYSLLLKRRRARFTRFHLNCTQISTRLVSHILRYPVSRIKQSQVDLYDPLCVAKFPRVAKALEDGVEAVLRPGEVLYIPEYWYHHIEAPYGQNTSINFWFSSDTNAPKPVEAVAEGGYERYPASVDPAKRLALYRFVEEKAKEMMGGNAAASTEFFRRMHRRFVRGGEGGEEGEEDETALTPAQETLRVQLVALMGTFLHADDVIGFFTELVEGTSLSVSSPSAY